MPITVGISQISWTRDINGQVFAGEQHNAGVGAEWNPFESLKDGRLLGGRQSCEGLGQPFGVFLIITSYPSSGS